MKKSVLLFSVIVMALTVRGEDKMNTFINNLMSKMTLQEKI